LDDQRVIEAHPAKRLRIGPQRIADHVRVAPVVLGPGRREAVPKAIELLRINGVDAKSALDAQLDQRPARDFNANRHCRRVPVRALEQRVNKGLQGGRGVRHAPPVTHLSLAIEDAHFVRLRGPINSDKPPSCQHLPSPLEFDSPWRRITPVLALDGATPHGMDSTDYLAGALVQRWRWCAGTPWHSRRGSRAWL
jgi:hypothetical protein